MWRNLGQKINYEVEEKRTLSVSLCAGNVDGVVAASRSAPCDLLGQELVVLFMHFPSFHHWCANA